MRLAGFPTAGGCGFVSFLHLLMTQSSCTLPSHLFSEMVQSVALERLWCVPCIEVFTELMTMLYQLHTFPFAVHFIFFVETLSVICSSYGHIDIDAE
jgi:hypothetical protein